MGTVPTTSLGSRRFTRIQVWLMAIVAGLGAAVIGLSVVFHTRIPTRVSPITLNEHQPSKVLVAVEGSAEAPAFIGLLAVVNPHSNALSVVPIKGTTKINGMPLYLAIQGTKPKVAIRIISQATGIPIHHYFFMTAADLTLVLNALYYHARHWPKSETPSIMASTLGYPYGQDHGWKTIHLLTQIVSDLPGVSPIAASHLLGVPKTSVTNLTSYQLFLLAQYIRGEALQLGYNSQYRTP